MLSVINTEFFESELIDGAIYPMDLMEDNVKVTVNVYTILHNSRNL